MTTMGNNKMVFCKNCVNCIRISSLNNDVVLWDCENGKFSGIVQNSMTCDGLVQSDSHEFGLLMVEGCDGFDSGHHAGKDAEIFKDVIVCNHNVKRKQKAWDFYEGCWRK